MIEEYLWQDVDEDHGIPYVCQENKFVEDEVPTSTEESAHKTCTS